MKRGLSCSLESLELRDAHRQANSLVASIEGVCHNFSDLCEDLSLALEEHEALLAFDYLEDAHRYVDQLADCVRSLGTGREALCSRYTSSPSSIKGTGAGRLQQLSDLCRDLGAEIDRLAGELAEADKGGSVQVGVCIMTSVSSLVETIHEMRTAASQLTNDLCAAISDAYGALCAENQYLSSCEAPRPRSPPAPRHVSSCYSSSGSSPLSSPMRPRGKGSRFSPYTSRLRATMSHASAGTDGVTADPASSREVSPLSQLWRSKSDDKCVAHRDEQQHRVGGEGVVLSPSGSSSHSSFDCEWPDPPPLVHEPGFLGSYTLDG
ncbi:unnamed protein product [Vitrella brassicaformis CCMP3155]|uniref:Uncharacterized protein n=1 Tax=Vitrella brassicaformis (strain CCMP3155) TaxID=1169540 RepID=A0A0G4ETS7_VITBC|nr:unnamed protein product [Vitrella brassicaformis CCMP3155]|eukprot:CEM01463.1 unnamed protein product [Vitrella brassicaformis CCMP3155]